MVRRADRRRGSGTEGLEEGCGAVARGSIGAGLASADLDTDMLRPRSVAPLDRADVTFGRVLHTRPGGLLVRGRTGFWDIALDAEPRWYESSGIGSDIWGDVWAVDLDGDEDGDVVIQEPAIVEDSERDAPDTIRYVLKLWERVGDELIARTQLPSTHEHFSDRHGVGRRRWRR